LKTRLSSLVAIVAAFIGFAFVSLASVHAATITVQDTGDGAANAGNCPGSGCRLRDALAAASDGDTIDFSVTGTILLTNGHLLVDKSVTISGPGAAQLAVNGNANGRVFYIGSGKTVSISGLTITNGSGTENSIAVNGGGFYNDHATLTLSNCSVSGNSSTAGGGIWNDGSSSGNATLTIRSSTISGNSTSGGGGGIGNDGHNGGHATCTVENSTISAQNCQLPI